MMNLVSWYGDCKIFAIELTKLSSTDNLLRQRECGNSEFKHTDIHTYTSHYFTHHTEAIFLKVVSLFRLARSTLFFSLHFHSKN